MKGYLQPLALSDGSPPAAVRQFVPSSQPEAQWVQLAVLPHPYSHSQALLLCKMAEDEWLVWIPGYGEATLHVSEFFPPQGNN